MNIPVKITPCPINSAVAEVRFESALPADAVFGTVYPAFKDAYPMTTKLPIADLPSIVRDNDPNLKFLPHHQLTSGKYIVQIGPRSFSVARQGEYTGWSDFGKTITAAVHRFLMIGIAKTITRISIRYINFYEGADIFKHFADVSLQFGGVQLRSAETMVRASVQWESFQHILTVSNTAENQEMKDGVIKKKTGSVVDIDTFLLDYKGDLVREYGSLLERMHTAEKSLFFSLFKPEFIASLQPKY